MKLQFNSPEERVEFLKRLFDWRLKKPEDFRIIELEFAGEQLLVKCGNYEVTPPDIRVFRLGVIG